MKTSPNNWLEQIIEANHAFTTRIEVDALPVARQPGPAIITCMDPRVNLEAIGIPQFAQNGSGTSSVRIIRTIGGIAEHRSLLIGLFLAGIREIVVLIHTDCGCCLAHSRIDTLIENMQKSLSPADFEAYKSQFPDPFSNALRTDLKTFDDPYIAVAKEVSRIKNLIFTPDDLIVHGLVYDLQSGKVEIIVNGYE